MTPVERAVADLAEAEVAKKVVDDAARTAAQKVVDARDALTAANAAQYAEDMKQASPGPNERAPNTGARVNY